MTVKETVWHPDPNKSPDDEKNKKTTNRVLLFGHRLGVLVKKDDDTFDDAPGIHGFADRIGKAQVIIDVVHDEYTKKDGTKGKSAKLQFVGVYALNDPKVKDVVRGSSDGLASSATTAGGLPQTGKRDFSDL